MSNNSQFYSTYVALSDIPQLDPYRFLSEQYENCGVHISVLYNNGEISVSFYPSDGPGNFNYDGRTLGMTLFVGMKRFSQKTFDMVLMQWKPFFKQFAAVYAMVHEIDSWRAAEREWQKIEKHLPYLRCPQNDHDAFFNGLLKEIASEYFNINPTNINPTSSDCAQSAPEEVTTPTNEMETTINPALSVSTVEGDAASQRIATAINTALANNADCVYNLHLEGDQTAYKAPDFGKLRDFIDTPDGEEFVAFDGAERVTMLDICNAHPSKSNPFNKMMTFSEESKKMVSEHKDAFKVGAQGVMILRVDLTGGSWYEFAINRAV